MGLATCRLNFLRKDFRWVAEGKIRECYAWNMPLRSMYKYDDSVVLVLNQNPSVRVARKAPLHCWHPFAHRIMPCFEYAHLVTCLPCLPCCMCFVVDGQGGHGDHPGAERYRGCPQAHAVQRDATRGHGSKKSRQEHGFAAQLSRQGPSGTGHDSGNGHTIGDVSQATIRRFLDHHLVVMCFSIVLIRSTSAEPGLPAFLYLYLGFANIWDSATKPL